MSSHEHLKIGPGGVAYLGDHVTVDLHGCHPETLQVGIVTDLVRAAEYAGGTVLHDWEYVFAGGEGVTAFCALAESHISIHTWPETGQAALDVFMCGDCNPHKAAAHVIEALAEAGGVKIETVWNTIHRGYLGRP